MANPQPDQFTRLSNEILEEIIKFKFNATQLKIIIVVWRYTYGFSRKSHPLSLTFIAEAIGTSKTVVKRELDTLIKEKVISVIQEATFNIARDIGFNKDYEQWSIPTSIQSTNEYTVPQEVDLQYTGKSTLQYTHRSTKKESIKENSKETYNINFEELWKLYPDKIGKGQVSDSKKLEIYKLGEEFKRCISRYIEDVEKRRNEGFKGLKYQNGKTFFNKGYIDYLDANQQEDKPKEVDINKPQSIGYKGSGY